MTIKACVIGWPISHSRSPIIHRYWLEKYRIDGTYDRIPVAPNAVDAFVGGLSANGYAGCNVTLPHKERMYELVASADPTTRALGAVNTVFFRNGRAMGTNTDGEGFLASIAAIDPSWVPRGKHVVILGAGGAARAIAATLSAEGANRLTLLNRSRDRAEKLRRDLALPDLDVADISRPCDFAGAALLVNTTSLGMKGQPPLDLDISSLPRSALVADIVYTPLVTDFLKRAEARGHTIIPGLGMLLHQAVRGFELWFGRRPEVTPELHGLVAADIAGRTSA